MYGYLPVYIGIAAMLLMCAVLSVYYSLFAVGVVFLRNRGFSEFVTAPLLWTVLEYLKSHLFTGFPWENLAYSQFQYIPIIQFTDITGVYGLSFVIMFINVLIYDLSVYRQKGEKILPELISGFIILVMIFAYGQFSIHRVAIELRRAPAMEVTLVQGNIDQNIKWNPQYQEKTVDIYKNLSLKKAPVGSGLIVWPETATPFFFQDRFNLSREVENIPKLTSDWLLFAVQVILVRERATQYMNSAYLLNPGGEISGKYDKVHLVPMVNTCRYASSFPLSTNWWKA